MYIYVSIIMIIISSSSSSGVIFRHFDLHFFDGPDFGRFVRKGGEALVYLCLVC